MTREAERRPGARDGVQEAHAGSGTKDIVTDPVPLTQAITELLELSDERDQWQQRLGDEYRLGWKLGYAAGIDDGRRLEAAELDEAWNRAAAPIARGGPSHDELEVRRWGPGGRAHFGDPRPGDYPGRQEGAA